MSLHLEAPNSVERPRIYSSYLRTLYPANIDPALAKEVSGIYSERRLYQNSSPVVGASVTSHGIAPRPIGVRGS